MTQTPPAPLVIRFGAMGDMVLLTVLLDMLRQRYGQACDLLTSGGWSRPLLAGQPSVAQITVLGSRTHPYWTDPQQWALVRALGRRPPGPVFVCDAAKQDKLRWLLERAGIKSQDCVYYPTDAASQDLPWVERWHRFGQLSPEAWPAPAAPRLPACPQLNVADNARSELRQFLGARGVSGCLWLLQPGSKRTLKRGRLAALSDHKWWPVERWAALSRALLDQGLADHVLLCGAPAEQPLLQAIATASASERVLPLGDDLPLPRLLALCEVASAMVSVDTGPAHAAVALGCPSVILFGAAPRRLWMPRGPTGTEVQGLGGPEDGMSRVEQISLDQVLAACSGLNIRR